MKSKKVKDVTLVVERLPTWFEASGFIPSLEVGAGRGAETLREERH